MRDSKDTVRGKRFTSEKTAKDFAKNVKGNVNDLRGNANFKSNFNVKYTKGNAQKRTDIESINDPYEDDNGLEADGSCDGTYKSPFND